MKKRHRAASGIFALVAALMFGAWALAPTMAITPVMAQETNAPTTNTPVNTGQTDGATPGVNPVETQQPGTVIERDTSTTTTTTTTDNTANWWPWLIVLGIVLLVLIIALASRPDNTAGPVNTHTERFERHVDHTV